MGAAISEQEVTQDLKTDNFAHGYLREHVKQYEMGARTRLVAFCGYIKEGPVTRPRNNAHPKCETCLDIIVERSSQDLHRL